jgi:hypothetical protein
LTEAIPYGDYIIGELNGMSNKISSFVDGGSMIDFLDSNGCIHLIIFIDSDINGFRFTGITPEASLKHFAWEKGLGSSYYAQPQD